MLADANVLLLLLATVLNVEAAAETETTARLDDGLLGIYGDPDDTAGVEATDVEADAVPDGIKEADAMLEDTAFDVSVDEVVSADVEVDDGDADEICAGTTSALSNGRQVPGRGCSSDKSVISNKGSSSPLKGV